MWSFCDWEITWLALTSLHTSGFSIIHVLNQCQHTLLTLFSSQEPTKNPLHNLVICFILINELHMEVLPLLYIPFHWLSYKENSLHCGSPSEVNSIWLFNTPFSSINWHFMNVLTKRKTWCGWFNFQFINLCLAHSSYSFIKVRKYLQFWLISLLAAFGWRLHILYIP